MGMAIGFSNASAACGTARPPMPDPYRFRVIHWQDFKASLLVEVEYPGCTTFDGRKLLVFRDMSVNELEATSVLDPHFTELEPRLVARFRADETGRLLAQQCCRNIWLNQPES